MKLKLYFLLLLFIPLALLADNISLEKAKEIGVTFMIRNNRLMSVTDLQMVYDGETETSRHAGADPTFYVFDNPNGKGFVIVAGDDMAIPVLGYSAENNFPSEIPTNVAAWLEGLKDEINYAREQNNVSTSRGSSNDFSIGEVLMQLKTAQWNQSAPYNNYTPQIEGKQSYTGCVITATAIIMKYHQWPERGTGTLPGYTTDNKKATLSERELGHVYDWSQMPNQYKSGNYSSEEAHQVAQLMSDLGIMLQANYDANSTSAVVSNVGPLLIEYMDYDKSALYYDRYNYATSDWTQMIIDELNANCPVIYSGFNDKSGHAFVVDGYTSNNYFSINWGWGGSYNGYFMLNALEPNGSGIGGNYSHYNYNQGAVLGLKKNEGGDYVISMGFGEKGFSTTTTEFNRYTPFVVNIDRLSNKGGSNFTGTVLFALTDKEGIIKEELYDLNVNALKPRWGFSNLNVELTIKEEMEIGDRIRVFFKSQNESEWTLIKGGDNCIWEILITDEYSIEETTFLNYNKSTQKLTVKTKDGVVVELLKENGTSMESSVGSAENEVVFDVKNLPTASYKLKLSKSFEIKEVKLKLGNNN